MIATVVFWISAGLLALHYAVYPLVLLLLSSLSRRRREADPEAWPAVSVLISARNEERNIGARIENLLAQDYPGTMEILVGSDASDDRTDEIVEGYGDRGARLLRADARSGKPRMLQALEKTATGDVLVFTDADTVFLPTTVRALVRRFADPDTGCVDGVRRNSLESETCESTYMKYERWIKRMCSRLGIVLGGTGAVFALRRTAFEPLAADRADDFELAVMARVRGFRCVYEPGAVALEPSPDDSRQYRRMVRIVSWMSGSGIRLAGRALRPARPGLLLQLAVHKFLRWVSGFLILAATSSAFALFGREPFTLVSLCLAAFHLLAAAGWLAGDRLPGPFRFPFYFWLMNAAAMVGVLRMVTGRPVETWETGRSRTTANPPAGAEGS